MNPLILAVDTTHEHGSLALTRGREVVEEVALHSPSGFGQVLYGAMEQLLERNGAALRDVDCFATASGPGSFTGVRVGLACVKGLAEALGKPALAVSNLRALAEFGRGPLRAVVLDARRGDVYAALFDALGNAVGQETVTKFPAWLDTLPDDGVEFVCDEFEPYRPMLAGTRFESAPVTEAPHSLAAAVGRVASERFERGEAADPAALDANYVRRSDAELFWKEY